MQFHYDVISLNPSNFGGTFMRIGTLKILYILTWWKVSNRRRENIITCFHWMALFLSLDAITIPWLFLDVHRYRHSTSKQHTHHLTPLHSQHHTSWPLAPRTSPGHMPPTAIRVRAQTTLFEHPAYVSDGSENLSVTDEQSSFARGASSLFAFSRRVRSHRGHQVPRGVICFGLGHACCAWIADWDRRRARRGVRRWFSCRIRRIDTQRIEVQRMRNSDPLIAQVQTQASHMKFWLVYIPQNGCLNTYSVVRTVPYFCLL